MRRPHDELARLGRWMVGTFVLAMVLVLMSACGGGDHDPDAELREWCASFVGPLTQQQQAECDRVRGAP